MEPEGEGFRFTAEAWSQRDELLREAEDRIESARFEPPDASGLSETSIALLRRIAAGELVAITGANRPHSASLRQPGSSCSAIPSPMEMSRVTTGHIGGGIDSTTA
jgi:hypothetical protein